MKTFKRDRLLTKDEWQVYDTAHARFQQLPKMDALDWADLAGSGMARGLDDYRRLNDPVALLEAKRGLVQLLAALDVLIERG